MSRRPVAPTDGVDVLIGFTGFFSVVFFGVTVLCELTGRPALGWALTLLVLVVVLGLLLWRRRRIVHRAVDRAKAESPRRGPDAIV